MDKVDVLFKAHDYVATFIQKMRSVIVWIFVDGNRVYVTICGRDARRVSNAIYHALRAAGRHGLQRTPAEKRGCWVVSYV